MAILSAGEVFELAIIVEENGAAFYKRFADRFDEPESRELFNFLSSEEKRHREVFESMVKENSKTQDTGRNIKAPGYPDEYSDYLKAYADRLIFTGRMLENELSRIKLTTEVCEFGIRRELDSILYYQEIKTFVPAQDRVLIDDIINEERRHFMKLTEMKRDLQ
ncbi:MAG: ferritin family protein [Spirochaetes bacterium]|nr:ferritin family protein [Spirochaetota bacterium]